MKITPEMRKRAQLTSRTSGQRLKWTEAEVVNKLVSLFVKLLLQVTALVTGIHKFGKGNWSDILYSNLDLFGGRRTAVNLKVLKIKYWFC